MATTSQTFTGDGSATAFTIAFNYIDTTDVKASINDVATTAFSVSGNTVTFNSAPAASSTVKIFRDTNNETIQASFQSGSALRAVDFNDNFTQILYVSQETTTTADSAVTTANSAVTTANSAVTTANSATSTANSAVTTANSAVTTANAATATANTASTNASNAVTTANTASTNASAAVTTANSAETKADNAVSTANTASTNASNAVSTANTATTTANSAVTTANTASTNASNAVTTANNAQTAVNNAAIYVIVANVAAIPGSPSDQDRIEITDSSGVQSSSVVAGLPVGFVGDSGLFVRLKYQTSNSKWNFVQYGANDIDDRYVRYYSGNVGIGTTSPASILEIHEPDNTAAIVRLHGARTSSGNNCFFTGFGSRGSTASPSSLQASDIITTFNANAHDGSNYLSGGRVRFGVEAISTGSLHSNIQFLTNDGSSEDERMRIDSSGQLIIGATSSNHKLRVAGTGNASAIIGSTNAGGAQLVIDGDADGDGSGGDYASLLHSNSGNLEINNRKDASILFKTGSSEDERMRINSSGNVGVGTTSPSTKFVVSNAGAEGVEFSHSSGTNEISSYNRSTSARAPVDIIGQTLKVLTGNPSLNTGLFQDSSGNVGIGNSNPSHRLSIAGTANNTNSEITITATSVASAYIGANANGLNLGTDTEGIVFKTGVTGGGSVGSTGIERMRIDSSGRVLLNTTTRGHSDADNLTIADSGKAGITIRNTTTTGDGAIFFSNATSGTTEYAGYIEYRHSTNNLRFATSSAEAMRIDSLGNVGIGTTSPSTTLDVKASSASTYVAQFADSATTEPAKIYVDANGIGFVRGNFDDGIEFASNTARTYVNGTERMRIDSSGNVGIGTTSPSVPLEVSSSSFDSFKVVRTGAGTGAKIGLVNGDGNEFQIIHDGGEDLIFRYGSSDERMRIDSSGRLLVGLTSSSQIATQILQGSSFGASDPGILYLARGVATPAATQTIGSLRFSDNTHTPSAVITAARDGGTWSATSKPTYLSFQTTSNGATSGVERMRIDSSGNVLLGKASQNLATAGFQHRGDAIGLVQITRDSGEPLQLNRLTNDGKLIEFRKNTTSVVGAISIQGSDLGIEVNGSERVRIDSSGKVGIGLATTNPLVTNAWTNLQVNGANVASPVAARTSGTPPSNLHVSTNQYGADQGGSISFGSQPDNVNSYAAYGSVAGRRDSSLGYVYSGYLQFNTSDGSNLNERMRIDSSGMHTITASDNSTAVQIRDASNYAGQLITATNGTFEINARTTTRFTRTGSASESMRITSTGNVGIGTTDVQKALHVRKDGDSYPMLVQNRTNAASTCGIALIATGSDFADGQYASVEAISGGVGSTAHSLGFRTCGSGGTPSTAMQITSEGEMYLLGGSSSGSLHFWEGCNVTGNSDTGRLGHGKNGNTLIYINASTPARGVFAIGTSSSVPFVISTNNAERMRINSSGNVGIGTTSPSHPLEVRGVNTQINFSSSGTGGGYLMSTNSGQWGISGGVRWNGAGWYARHTSSSIIRDDGDGNMRFFTNAGNTVSTYITPGERLRIDNSGDLTIKTAKKGIIHEGDFTLANNANTTIECGISGMVQIAVKTHASHPSGNDDYKGALFYTCKGAASVTKIADPGGHFDQNQTTLNTGKINVASSVGATTVTITNKTGYSVTLVAGKCILN